MTVLFCYPNYPSSQTYGNVGTVWLNHIQHLQNHGFSIKPFCVSVNPPSNALSVSKLERFWKTANKVLLMHYDKLEAALDGCDVLLNVTGVNLHPAFIERISRKHFTVFQFNDDPESSELSRYLASAYDLSLIGNIAEVDTYKSWGIKHVEWMPIGLQPHLYQSTLTYEDILNGERDIDLFMMADRLAKWRTQRLDKLAKAFPDAHFYGRGWNRGYLDAKDEMKFLLSSKICPNIHNSTGPINYRTFYAPANGMMLICDNKKFLGDIYQLGVEAVGFDSIEECIDLCHYYIKNDEERRWIAANGWKRAVNDYNEVAVYKRTIHYINLYKQVKENNFVKDVNFEKPSSLSFNKWLYRAKYSFEDSSDFILKKIRLLKKRFNKYYKS